MKLGLFKQDLCKETVFPLSRWFYGDGYMSVYRSIHPTWYWKCRPDDKLLIELIVCQVREMESSEILGKWRCLSRPCVKQLYPLYLILL